MDNYTPQQIEKAFQLCDLLGLDDVTLAGTILEQMNWSVQKALESMMDATKEGEKKENKENKEQNEQKEEKEEPQPQLPENYGQKQQQNQSDNDDDQYVFDYQQHKKNNRENFDQAYQQLKLDRSTTQLPLKMQRRLSYDRNIIKDFGSRRHQYQAKLLQDSQKFFEKVLANKQKKLKIADQSRLRNQKNRQFICYLDKNYRCSINFTFGTFMLNLVRSHLDKKYLLVYIHNIQFEDSRSVRMILAHRQSSKFINRNCVCYGMFDNCDDYEIVQQYVPMKDLPAFALFQYNTKENKQSFISAYPILQKQPTNFLQWLASNTNISIQKKSEIKQQKKQKPKTTTQSPTHKYTHTDIMTQQNKQYQQMQRIYNMRRQQSKIKKQQITNKQKSIQKAKEKFALEPKMQDGKTILIKFRLPYSGKSIARVFSNQSPISELFDYVGCFGRDQFEDRYASFDLTQTFPKISLSEHKGETIKKMFEDSMNQNIIVKQI